MLYIYYRLTTKIIAQPFTNKSNNMNTTNSEISKIRTSIEDMDNQSTHLTKSTDEPINCYLSTINSSKPRIAKMVEQGNGLTNQIMSYFQNINKSNYLELYNELRKLNQSLLNVYVRIRRSNLYGELKYSVNDFKDMINNLKEVEKVILIFRANFDVNKA